VPEGEDGGTDGDVHHVVVEQDLDQSPEGPRANLATEGKPQIINPMRCVPLLATVWYLRESGRSCVGEPVSLVPRNVGSDPKLKIDGNRLVGVYPVSFLVGPSWGMHSSVCLGPPCKVISQSIVDLSPLSETA
jgi:hypothetical protein